MALSPKPETTQVAVNPCWHENRVPCPSHRAPLSHKQLYKSVDDIKGIVLTERSQTLELHAVGLYFHGILGEAKLQGLKSGVLRVGGGD